MFDYQRVDLNSSMVKFPQPVPAWPAFTSGDAADHGSDSSIVEPGGSKLLSRSLQPTSQHIESQEQRRRRIHLAQFPLSDDGNPYIEGKNYGCL